MMAPTGPDHLLPAHVDPGSPVPGHRDAFGQACGLDGPLRIDFRLRDGGAVFSHVTDLPFVLIGRDPRANLVLDHPDVSRRHAYLQVLDGHLFILDLKSRAGIAWADGPRPWGWVEPGYTLALGPFLIRPIAPSNSEESRKLPWPDPIHLPPPVKAPAVTLERTDWAAGPSRIRLDSALNLLGDDRDCQLSLTDPAISRFHAALLRTPSGPWIVDLMSRTGLLIEGEARAWGPLRDGDSLQLGSLPPFLVRVGPDQLPALLSDSPENAQGLPPLPFAEPFELFSADPLTIEIERLLVDRTDDSSQPTDALILQLLRHFGSSQQRMLDQFTQAMMFMAQTFGSLHRDQLDVVRSELDEIRRLSRELHQLQLQATPAVSPAEPSPPANRPPDPARPAPPSAPPPQAGQAIAHDKVHLLLSQRIAALQEERQSRWRKLVGMASGTRFP